jgi:hypothetical protein
MKCVDWAACGRQWVNANLGSVGLLIPVFDETNLLVRVDPRISPGVLCRTETFDKALAAITDQVRAGYTSGIEGMLYCLYVVEEGHAVPVYIGIVQALGHTGNLSTLFTNSRKKPRFDDYDGYHIGDLSTQVIPGYAKKKRYKRAWAKRMFLNAPSMKPKLRTQVYFWGTAWTSAHASAVGGLGHTSLALEEMIVIEACRAAYPGQLLNR